MSKFDRGVFIFIGLGIWALVMSQVFEPNTLESAETYVNGNYPPVTVISGKCPPSVLNHHAYITDGSASFPKNQPCAYLLTVSYGDVLKHPENFF